MERIGSPDPGNLSLAFDTVRLMLIDCDSCLAKDIACDDCVVSVIFKEGFLDEGPLDLNHDEADALSNLAEAGLVPQLRLVARSPQAATVEPWKDSAAG